MKAVIMVENLGGDPLTAVELRNAIISTLAASIVVVNRAANHFLNKGHE